MIISQETLDDYIAWSCVLICILIPCVAISKLGKIDFSILYFCLPFFLGFLYFSNKIKKHNEKMKETFCLKSATLFDNKVDFKFYASQYNFSCSHSEIEKMKLLITNTSCICGIPWGKFSFSFTLLNNKIFNIPLTFFNMREISSLIMYCKKFENFSYRYDDIAENIELTQKIEKMFSKDEDCYKKEYFYAILMCLIMLLIIGSFYYCDYVTTSRLESAAMCIIIAFSFFSILFVSIIGFNQKKKK